MDKKLWLKDSDIPELTSFSGNIDSASLLPHIYTAQRTEIKRILGVDLYNYIDDKIQSSTELEDEYKKLFDEYIIDILVYYSAMNYMAFGGYKTANSGIYKQTIENGMTVDYKEVNNLIERYRALGKSVEMDFEAYILTVNIPEYKGNAQDEGTLISGWF